MGKQGGGEGGGGGGGGEKKGGEKGRKTRNIFNAQDDAGVSWGAGWSEDRRSHPEKQGIGLKKKKQTSR